MRFTLRIAACAAVLAAAACRDAMPPAPQTDADPPRHIVLVTIDTLRADHLGAYGGNVETPHLDRLAVEGALVEQVTAHVPLTRPSHVSLMSGLLPTRTGVRDNVTPSPVPEVPLLAEVLGAAGFETAAFVSAVVVSRASGLGRGFDVYSDEFDASPEDPRFLQAAQKRGDDTLAGAVDWLEDRLGGSGAEPAGAEPRLFLWLHLYDPHEPYEPPEPHASRYPERPYAGEVAWTDELIGQLDDALVRLGVGDETLLVVTSDHGEGLGEHDELLHGFFAYETTLRVPLLVRGPGVTAGTRITQPVGLVDLYPTILDLAGIEGTSSEAISGRSLAGTLRGAEDLPAAPVYAETLVPRLKFGWSDLRTVRTGQYKYIQAPRPELYDLEADPGESHNLLRQERSRAREMAGVLEAFLDGERSPALDGAGATMDDAPTDDAPAGDLLEKLAALGYVGSATATTATPGADPKDKIEDFRVANALLREGLANLHAGDFEAGVESLEQLLERGVVSSEIHFNLGRALAGAERLDEAAEHFLETVARAPSHQGAWLRLAEARARLGDHDGALEALRTGQTQLPNDVGLRREEARLLRLIGKPDDARRVLEVAVDLAPSDAFLRAALSEVLGDLGDLDGAVERLRQAVEIEPAGAEYWNALGMILGGAGELAEAEQAFRRAWRLDDGDHRHAFNLGLAIARQGRAQEARPFFEATLEIEPGFEPARQHLAAIEAGSGR